MFFHSVAKDSTKYKRNLMVLVFFEGTSLIGEIFAICFTSEKIFFCSYWKHYQKRRWVSSISSKRRWVSSVSGRKTVSVKWQVEDGECQVTTKKKGECQVYQVKEGECQVSVQKGSECQVTSRRRWVSSNKWKKESVKCKVKEGECQVKEVSVK